MKGVILLVFLCSLVSLPSPGEGGIFGNIIGGAIGIVKGIAKPFLDVSVPVLRIGHIVIDPPLQVAEFTFGTVNGLKNAGLNVTGGVLKAAMKIAKNVEREIKTIDFPGKNALAMFLPGGVISIVDDVASTAVKISTEGLQTVGDAAKATVAWTIWASLKVVFSGFDLAMKAIGDCVPLSKQDNEIHNVLVKRIKTGEGKVCGIGHLTPEYNIKIKSDNKHFLVIVMPMKIPYLKAKFASVRTEPDFLEDEPLEAKIERVEVEAEVKFQRGTLLKFVRLHIRIVKLEGFKLKFLDPHKSGIMETVEALSSDIGKDVKKQINQTFKKLEKSIYDRIEGIKQ